MDKITNLTKYKLKKQPLVFSVIFKVDDEACYFSAKGIGDSQEERLRLVLVLEGAAKALRQGTFQF